MAVEVTKVSHYGRDKVACTWGKTRRGLQAVFQEGGSIVPLRIQWHWVSWKIGQVLSTLEVQWSTIDSSCKTLSQTPAECPEVGALYLRDNQSQKQHSSVSAQQRAVRNQRTHCDLDGLSTLCYHKVTYCHILSPMPGAGARWIILL